MRRAGMVRGVLLGGALLWLLAVPARGQERAAERLPLLDAPSRLVEGNALHAASTLLESTIIYDSGQPALIVSEGEARLEVYALGPGSVQANRFVKAPGDSLLRVAVAPYYDNDFTGTGLPADAPRDFSLVFFAADGRGAPGDSLGALYVEDDRINLANAFEFLDVRLDTLVALQARLLPLDTVYVGLLDAGDDPNYLAMGVSEYADPEAPIVSFLWRRAFFEGQGGWRRFDAVYSEVSGDSLFDRVLPIRATLSAAPQGGVRVAIGGTVGGSRQVGVADSGPLPAHPALLGNYPNPFNPVTTIRYALPQPGPVRVAVYDLLGREVAVLVEGVQPAGLHALRVEAHRWPSGIYLYTLDAAGHRQTRRMILLK